MAATAVVAVHGSDGGGGGRCIEDEVLKYRGEFLISEPSYFTMTN